MEKKTGEWVLTRAYTGLENAHQYKVNDFLTVEVVAWRGLLAAEGQNYSVNVILSYGQGREERLHISQRFHADTLDEAKNTALDTVEKFIEQTNGLWEEAAYDLWHIRYRKEEVT